MIDVIVPHQKMSNYMTYLGHNIQYLISKYLDYDKYSFDAFNLTVISNETISYNYEIIKREELFHQLMPDYKGNGPIIKFTDNQFLGIDAGYDPMSFYIHPQFTIKNGDPMIDIYSEPAAGYEDAYRDYFANDTKILQLVLFQAIGRLDFVETNLKKDIKKIKKLMPTPEQIARSDKTETEYRSQPIKIKDISVQYVYVPHESRKYQRHCEAWGVRGHYRHYKSGKMVYIQPHTKGKGKLKTTQYIIGG